MQGDATQAMWCIVEEQQRSRCPPPRPEGLMALVNAIIDIHYTHIHLPESRPQNVKLYLRSPLVPGSSPISEQKAGNAEKEGTYAL
jgi:hypothetical protein